MRKMMIGYTHYDLENKRMKLIQKNKQNESLRNPLSSDMGVSNDHEYGRRCFDDCQQGVQV